MFELTAQTPRIAPATAMRSHSALAVGRHDIFRYPLATIGHSDPGCRLPSYHKGAGRQAPGRRPLVPDFAAWLRVCRLRPGGRVWKPDGSWATGVCWTELGRGGRELIGRSQQRLARGCGQMRPVWAQVLARRRACDQSIRPPVRTQKTDRKRTQLRHGTPRSSFRFQVPP